MIIHSLRMSPVSTASRQAGSASAKAFMISSTVGRTKCEKRSFLLSKWR